MGEGWGIRDNVLPAQKNQQVAPNKAKGASGEIDLQQHMCLKGITLKPLSRNQSDKERRVWRFLIEEEAAGDSQAQSAKNREYIKSCRDKGAAYYQAAINGSRERVSHKSPVPPGQEGGRREAQDSQGKSKLNSPSLACFPPVSCEAKLRSILKEWRGKGEWSQNLRAP